MRQTLPNRRLSETISFTYDNLKFHGGAGYVEQDSGLVLQEIFFDAGKSGSMASVLAREWGITCSFALRQNCPLDALTGAFLRHEDGAPASPMSAFFDELAGK